MNQFRSRLLCTLMAAVCTLMAPRTALTSGATSPIKVGDFLQLDADRLNAYLQAGIVEPVRGFDTGDSYLSGWGAEYSFEHEENLKAWDVLFSVGVDQLNLSGLVGKYTVRGAVLSFPSATVYFSRIDKVRFSYFYCGAGGGRMSLRGASLTHPSSGVVEMSGETYSLNLVLGLSKCGFFIEPGYHLRYFPGLQFKAGALPTDLPGRLNASGVTLRVGYEGHGRISK